jgi:hypothetical protein
MLDGSDAIIADLGYSAAYLQNLLTSAFVMLMFDIGGHLVGHEIPFHRCAK